MGESLPSPRAVLTSLFAELSSCTPPLLSADSTNTPADLSQKHKQLLLTLHCLYPNELLPALDLLDKNLVTKLVCMSASLKERAVLPSDKDNKGSNYVYYVRSSQSGRANSHPYRTRFPTAITTVNETQPIYEIRLDAWNCSCPAFSFAAFGRDVQCPVDNDNPQTLATDQTSLGDYIFGGLSLGESAPPLCKHLLACAIAERCDNPQDRRVVENMTSREELAGWAAGWGE